jgi:hypothetical protein
MKKLKRDAEKFDVLELFADMAAEHGYDLNDPVAQEDFVSRVRSSIEESKKSNIAIFGKRIESLFAYVAGALGKVISVKARGCRRYIFLWKRDSSPRLQAYV